jgi:CBS domain-containing protein
VADPHPANTLQTASATANRRNACRTSEACCKNWLKMLHPGPDSTEELIASLSEAEDRHIINTESRVMLEGVLRLSGMTAGDVMVAAPRMDVLDIDAAFDDLLHAVIDTAHSRFPVFEDERENIIGILLAKDLLKLQRAPELNLRALLRPATFIPETKGLNDLLREFRGNRNHLAIVIDEFGAWRASSPLKTCWKKSLAKSKMSSMTTKKKATFFRLPTAPGASVATHPWHVSTNISTSSCRMTTWTPWVA